MYYSHIPTRQAREIPLKPRLAVITSLFPIREEPHRGQPIYKTILALRKFAEIHVFSPMSVYPPGLKPASYVYRRADPSYSPPGVSVDYFEYFTVPVVGRFWNGAASGRAVFPQVRAFQPNLILSYWLYPDGFGAVSVGKRLRIPVIIGSRGSDLLKIQDNSTLRQTRAALQQAAAVLTVSRELSQKAIGLGAPPDKVHTVLNGCDTSIFAPQNPATARAELSIDPHTELILFVGHLIPGKGLNELWDAFLHLAERRPRLIVACLGEGSMHSELAARAATAGLAQRFLLPGPRPAKQIAAWLNACDVFCLPSHSEGCPNVVLEALSCGRPVVGTTVGAIPDLVQPSSGRLVQPNNPQALTAALDEVLSTSWDQARIAASFQRSWDDTARDTFDVCAGVLGLSKKPASH